MDERLASLLVDLSDMSDEEAEQAVLTMYGELYLTRGKSPKRTGAIHAHDEERVVFFEDRFDHAFAATVAWLKKGPFDRRRGERVAWIGTVVRGEIAGTECWLMPPEDRRPPPNDRLRRRLYIVREESYVVWLEPLRSGGWKFSSAYVAGHGDIRRYQRLGRRFWAQKNTP